MWNELYRYFLGIFSFDCISRAYAPYAATAVLWCLALGLTYVVYRLLTGPVTHLLVRFTRKTPTNWDDYLLAPRNIRSAGYFVAALMLSVILPDTMAAMPDSVATVVKICSLLKVFTGVNMILRILSTVITGLENEDIRIHGIVILRNIVSTVVICIGVLISLSIILNRDIAYLLSGIGAMAAVLMLVFKDSILGVVAGVKLTVNRMLRIGDWIRVPRFGADGVVRDITLSAVKVENWDNSIVTIPPYELISGGFNNMEEMKRSGGRRIKRSVLIDLNSIRYLSEKEQEKWLMDEWAEGIDLRRPQVNLTLYRRYLEWLIMTFPTACHDMLNMVRELEPTSQGVPIEFYLFTGKVNWKEYEAVAAEVSDAVLASAPEFGLRIYQAPAGSDITERVRKVAGATVLPVLFAILPFAAQGSTPSDTLDTYDLQEVVITSQSATNRMRNTHIGAENLELAKLAVTPALFGENDILKSITLMPGVSSEGEGSGGFEVRGGTAANNLVTLDGISLYNPSHVMGIFSTFNDRAIGGATLYKGTVPAGFGGASSAVLETTLAPGDMERWHGSGTVGILAAKIQAGGPVVKDKLSVAVTARRSYVDMFLKMVPKYRDIVMNFYDVTGKVRYRPRRDDYIDLSVTASRDNLCVDDKMRLHWGNVGVSGNWTASRGDAWRFVTTGVFSDFSTDIGMSMMGSDQRLTGYIRNVSVNERISYTFSDSHSLEFGVRSELQRVRSGEFEVNGLLEQEVRSGWSNAAWVNYDGSFADRFHISGGVRLSLFSALSGRDFNRFVSVESEVPDMGAKNWFDAEPRVSMKYDITPCHNIKAGVGVNTQNIHALRMTTTSIPFDRYTLSSAEVRPERAVQYSAGYAGMTSDGEFDWSAEGYYKDIYNVYDFKDGKSIFSDINLESLILGGKGRSYGIELMVRKNTGKVTGWVSYTLSKTTTKIDGINGGRWYDASNDRRHHFSIVGIWAVNDQWNVSASWMYSSGTPITAPDVKFEIDGATCYYYSQRNGYRTPSVNRLDLSATYTHRGPKLTYQWAFGVYNAYCRYNPFMVYFQDNPDSPSGTQAVVQALYGLIPSVSYTLSF